MTKEETQEELDKTKLELDHLKTEYGKLVSRYRLAKAMVKGVMRELDEPETQFQQRQVHTEMREVMNRMAPVDIDED